MWIEKDQNYDITSQIQDLENDLLHNKWLRGISEVTYKYDNDGFNKTLFTDFAWINKTNDHKLLLSETEAKLNNILTRLEKIQNTLKKYESKGDKNDIIIWYIEYIYNIFRMTLLWLPFEVEKATRYIWLNSNEILNRRNEIEELDKQIFWWLMSQNSFETTKCCEYIEKSLNEWSTRLSENEFMFLNIILSKFKWLETYDENLLNSNINKNSSEIPDVEINRDDYVKIFELIYEIYWIKKHVNISWVTNVTDLDESLEIPDNKEYSKLKLSKVLELINHEIETHWITLHNNKLLLGNIKWWWQLNREESLAKMSEGVLIWKSLEDFVNISFSGPEILAGEILETDEYKKFLQIYLKLIGKDDIYNVDDRLLRRKRNYPIGYKWVQHKDTSYSRWFIDIINYIESGKDIKDLYTAQVDFKDIDKVIKIQKDWKHEIKYPKMLSEVILYKIKNGTLNINSFRKYLGEKYLNIINKNHMSSVKKLNISQKKQLIEILGIIKKNER